MICFVWIVDFEWSLIPQVTSGEEFDGSDRYSDEEESGGDDAMSSGEDGEEEEDDDGDEEDDDEDDEKQKDNRKDDEIKELEKEYRDLQKMEQYVSLLNCFSDLTWYFVQANVELLVEVMRKLVVINKIASFEWEKFIHL